MALDTEKTKDSLFGFKNKSPAPVPKRTIKAPAAERSESEEHQHKPIEKAKDSPQPQKWQTFDKVTVLLTSEQKQRLDSLAKKIMTHRKNATRGNPEKERITANTIMRALIDGFLAHENDVPLEIMTSEEDVHAWMQKFYTSQLRKL